MADIFFKKIVKDDFIRQLNGASNLVLPNLPKTGMYFLPIFQKLFINV